MKRYVLLICNLGLIAFCAGCSTLEDSELLYPEDKGALAMVDLSQFDALAKNSERYVGKEIKLAGRVEESLPSRKGYEILAKWRPYPKKDALEQGPKDPDVVTHRHFLFRFEGKREGTFFQVPGNEFILEGWVLGKKEVLINVFGTRKTILYVNAKCINVWDTGTDEISDSPDSQYPEARSQTHCVES